MLELKKEGGEGSEGGKGGGGRWGRGRMGRRGEGGWEATWHSLYVYCVQAQRNHANVCTHDHVSKLTVFPILQNYTVSFGMSMIQQSNDCYSTKLVIIITQSITLFLPGVAFICDVSICCYHLFLEPAVCCNNNGLLAITHAGMDAILIANLCHKPPVCRS